MGVLVSAPFLAFLSLAVLFFSVYASIKIRGKTSDVWGSALFHFVIQFGVLPLALMFGGYFASVFMGTGLLAYSESLVISSVVMGFFYFVKIAKLFM